MLQGGDFTKHNVSSPIKPSLVLVRKATPIRRILISTVGHWWQVHLR
jgi:hypothetical protein